MNINQETQQRIGCTERHVVTFRYRHWGLSCWPGEITDDVCLLCDMMGPPDKSGIGNLCWRKPPRMEK